MLLKLHIDNLFDTEQHGPSVDIACKACFKFLQAVGEFDFTA